MRRRYVVAFTALLIVLCALAAAWPRPEPRYQGRRLRLWLEDFHGGDAATVARATEAVRQIGTNGLPVVIAEIRAKDSAGKMKMMELLARYSPIRPHHFFPANMRRRAALEACAALGPSAESAVPVLEEQLGKTSPLEAVEISFVLTQTGPAGIRVLAKAATNNAAAVRVSAKVALELLEKDPPILFGGEPQLQQVRSRLREFERRVTDEPGFPISFD